MNVNTQIRTVGRKYQSKQGKENNATIYISQKEGGKEVFCSTLLKLGLPTPLCPFAPP